MTIEYVVFRAADYETPLWAFPNLSSGRYNLAGQEPPTQYFSLHPMTPWAELLRWLDLRDADDARGFRCPIWTVRVTLEEEPIAVNFETSAGFGVESAELVADDHSICRRLAKALFDSGVRALVAPSAALPGTSNLMVLEPAVVVDYHASPFDSQDFPTALVARDGRCPEGLWDAVHFRGSGARHEALEAHEEGLDFAFMQPAVDSASLRS